MVQLISAQALSDPVATVDISDDFLTGLGTTGNIGRLGWNFSGGAVTVNSPTDNNYPGIVKLSSSAVINTVAAMFPRSTAATGIGGLPAFWDCTFIIGLDQVDANTQLRLGVSVDGTSETPANAVFVERLGTDTNFLAVSRAASVELNPRADLSVVADTNYHKFRIRRLSASTVGFTADAGVEVVVTTQVPTTGNFQPFLQIKTLEAAAKLVKFDFFRLRMTGLVR